MALLSLCSSSVRDDCGVGERNLTSQAGVRCKKWLQILPFPASPLLQHLWSLSGHMT